MAGNPPRAQLQLQMGEKDRRFCAACVLLPYGPPPNMTVASVKEAFLKSQETASVITITASGTHVFNYVGWLHTQ